MKLDGNAPSEVNGADLVAARQELGLSQSQLAELLDVPVNTLARWERGEVTIRHPRILALALRALALATEGVPTGRSRAGNV